MKLNRRYNDIEKMKLDAFNIMFLHFIASFEDYCISTGQDMSFAAAVEYTNHFSKGEE